MVKIQRIDDNSFLFFSKSNQEVILRVDSELVDAESKYNLAKRVANSLARGKEQDTFLVGNKKWSVAEDSRIPTAMKRAGLFSTMIHKSSDDNVIRIRIQEVRSQTIAGVHDAAIAQQKNLKFAKDIEKINYKNSSQLSQKEFNEHIRGKAILTRNVSSSRAPLFSDPFTQLATLAFQKFEKEFTSKDYFRPEQCDFCIVKRGNHLLLVNKKNHEINNATDSRATVQLYKDYLVREYGQDKVRYIEHLYHMDLDNTEYLTPEHIYRFNIGVNNIEIQDIQAFLSKCQVALKQFDPFTGDITDEDLSKSLEHSFGFNGLELRGLSSVLKKPTLGDLREWLYGMAPLPESANELSPEQFQLIMGVYRLNSEEFNNALTGRRIYKFIVSGYTNAETAEYKPWVDQQQLMQTMAKLEQCNDQLEFHEKLAFVIAKNHLAREHPVERFRVGAIIPGPKDKDGKEHYFRVSSFISNSYGIVSLTLSPACNDPELHSIKVYRSTASSPYSLQAAESLLQDFFLVSSPGYKGTGLADPYEKSFYDQRSIPIWLGYLTWSENEESHKERYRALFGANQALLQSFEHEHQPKDLKAIFKSNPFIEEILLTDECFWGAVKTDVDSNMMAVVFQLLDYIRENKNAAPNKALEVKLAKKFLKELEKIPLEQKSLKMQIAAAKIREELHHHILSKSSEAKAKSERKEFDKHIFNRLTSLQKKVEKAIAAGNNSIAQNFLNQWAESLSTYAEELGESLESKVKENLSITGHSLGGALVQSQFTYHVTDKMRMPLPEQTFTLYEFDAPGIEEDDNAFAKRMMIDHAEMLRKLHVGFHCRRRQEAGDIVPMSGKEHLFAANSLEEERLLEDSGVVFIDQAVRKRLGHAKTPTLAQARFAHETQFGEGTRQRTFLDEAEEEGDYIETFYTPFIQKLFDRAGKLGNTPSEIKRNQENFKKNFKKLWGLSSLGGVWTPDSAERLRTWPGVPTLFIRKTIYESIGEDRSLPFQDENGVFAVLEDGLASS